MKHSKLLAILAALGVLISTLVVTASADTGQTDDNQPVVISVTAPSGTTVVSDPVGIPVSYGLRVLAARDEMVFSGLCGNEITISSEDICRAMNLSSLSYITLTSLPAPGDGTLFVGSMGAAVGQTIPSAAISLMSFSSARPDAPCEAAMSFTVNGTGYPLTCKFCLLDDINYTPTVALAPELSLEVLTYCDIPVMGSLSSYDPEGDLLTYEITGYATHGRVKLNDKHTGCYTYTPDRGYVGKDSFSYVVRDNYGNYSTSATVSVQVSAVPASATYADLNGESCAAAAMRITEIGFMNGVKAGNDSFFRPAAGMSRAEFLVTAMNVAGVRPDASVSGDLPTVIDASSIPKAMRPYVALALSKGYLTGKSSGEEGKVLLAPDEIISRAEAAVILSNIIGYARQTTVSAFADEDALPAWSVPALTSMRALGILTSPDDTARPRDGMTRGEAVVWFERTFRLMAG